MRGKAACATPTDRITGITPAYAGKRICLDVVPDFFEDHPRLCGEKRHFFRRIRTAQGSPPPMRGKGFLKRGTISQKRITPAYAGKSSAFICSSPVNQDHPRLCGEKTIFGKRLFHSIGSPPPMRGKVVSNYVKAAKDGITPAYAGKSIFSYSIHCSL